MLFRKYIRCRGTQIQKKFELRMADVRVQKGGIINLTMRYFVLELSWEK